MGGKRGADCMENTCELSVGDASTTTTSVAPARSVLLQRER